MRIVEYQHRDECGGNDVRLDNETWEHGELVLIVSKREFQEWLQDVLDMMPTRSSGTAAKMLREMKEQIDKL